MRSQSESVTGIILAGGKSSRMGQDKALLEVGGRNMIERVMSALRAACSQVIIVSNTADGYGLADVPVYPDLYPDTGPLGGIYTGLQYTHTDWNIVVACDMPFVSEAMLNDLLLKTRTGGYRVVVPEVNGQLQPLCAGYHRMIKDTLRTFILDRKFRMQAVIRQLGGNALVVDYSGTATQRDFVNINTPAELEQINRTL